MVRSLLTELVIALVVRHPTAVLPEPAGTLLLGSTFVLAVITPIIPWLPFASSLGFVPLPATLIVALALITAAYVVAAEATKKRFYRATPRSSEHAHAVWRATSWAAPPSELSDDLRNA